MPKDIIPQEDNTSEILKADLLKFDYMVKRNNKLKKNGSYANPSKRQELAIKYLEEEHDELMNDLNAAKMKTNEDEKYRAKFADILLEIRRTETELDGERQTEDEVDKEIVMIENKLVNLGLKNKKKVDKNPSFPNTTTVKVIEYNRLLDEQNQLKMQIESLLKKWQQVKNDYDKLMNKLNKGKHIMSELSEQVKRTFQYRNDAMDRLETYTILTKTHNDDQKNYLALLNQRLYDDLKMTEFLSVKVKKRETKICEVPAEEDPQLLALNAEAETFIKHLINIADEKNLEKIMEDIIRMDLDNKCLFEFLSAVELHLTEAENALDRSRSAVADRTRALSEMLASGERLWTETMREHRSQAAQLRDARRTLRLMDEEWRRTCAIVDGACDLMGAHRNGPLDRGLPSDGRGPRQRPPDPDDVVAYFGPVDRRLDDVLDRLFWTQDYCATGDGGNNDDEVGRRALSARQRFRLPATVAGDSMSTGSEQEDDFLAKDLDNTANRHAKMMTGHDSTVVPRAVQLLDVGSVPSLCPKCLEKRYGDDASRTVFDHGERPPAAVDGEAPIVSGLCRADKMALADVEGNEDFKKYFHRTADCPLNGVKKSRKKR